MRRLPRPLAALALALAAGCGGAAADTPAPTPDVAGETDAIPDTSHDPRASDGAGGDAAGPAPLAFVAVTFNTGTGGGWSEAPSNLGYGEAQAAWNDALYGNGLAWEPFVEATRAWLAAVDPDIVAFQEIFWPGDCPSIPAEARAGFVCEGWAPGDPSVAERLLGPDFQVACHPGKPDKCLAVHRRLGTFRGCDGAFCLDGLDGGSVAGCGKGARVGRGVIALAGGGELTVVNVHGSSGFTEDDAACRVRQFEQVFVDLGDGAPAASGARNLVLGDLNTDPGRLAEADPSAARWLDFVGDGRPFRFLTEVGPDAEATYGGLVNIDHVVSDAFEGTCWHAGVTAGHPPVMDAVFFDHHPAVCAVTSTAPRDR